MRGSSNDKGYVHHKIYSTYCYGHGVAVSKELHRRDWDDLGKLDPLWAILSNSKFQFGKWDVENFFATGVAEVDAALKQGVKLGYPTGYERALDFGCGVGRVTRALGNHFRECIGLDISQSMINKAKELNAGFLSCKFAVNADQDLRKFSNDYFDMIYTNIVLQHLPTQNMIKQYISEFIRTLKRGGLLIFQLASYIPIKNRIQLRRRVYSLLRTIGVSEEFLYNKMKLHPIGMTFSSRMTIVAFLKQNGATLLRIDTVQLRSNESSTYYVTKT